MATSSKKIIETFNTFYYQRVAEGVLREFMTKYDNLDPNKEVELISYQRVEQAEAYADLMCFSRKQYLKALQWLLVTGQLKLYHSFAGFFVSMFDFPIYRQTKKNYVSKELSKYLFANANEIRGYNFRFSDFEEAYKEAVYQNHVKRSAKATKQRCT